MALPTPSPTLYVSNLETKTKKPELREQLYALFTPYGRVIDVIAKKHGGGRGQAFVVYEEQASATSAMRALTGTTFYNRDLCEAEAEVDGERISYSKTPSHATLSLHNPEASREAALLRAAKTVISNAQGEYEQLEKERAEEEAGLGTKRELEDGEGGPGKRQRVEQDEEEMEIEMDEDDDDGAGEGEKGRALVCSNLPPDCTDQILTALFSSYAGFSKAIQLPSSYSPPSSHPPPNPKAKSFRIQFDTPAHAQAAVKPNQGFNMQPGWDMGVSVE